jgi:hypothetical protein
MRYLLLAAVAKNGCTLKNSINKGSKINLEPYCILVKPRSCANKWSIKMSR